MPDIIGEPLKDYVIDQIKTRQRLHGKLERTPDEIFLLNSPNAWIKLASATKVDEKILKKSNIPNSSTLGKENNLAKQYILFGGTSELNESKNELTQREGFQPLSSSVPGSSSYLKSNNYGYVPMPGITSVDVKNLNRGSIKKATVKLKAYSIEQFRIIDLLYLRLGYTVMLEWGNSFFPKNQNDENKPIEKFSPSYTLIEKYFYNNDDYNKILRLIEAVREVYYGNYDGFIAKVSNFSWDFNQDGSYDITLTLISLGDVVESLKTNISPDSTTTNFILGTQVQFGTDLSLNPPTPVEDNKTTSIIHSMLYVWKWIDEVNHRPGNLVPTTQKIKWEGIKRGEMLSNQLASNLTPPNSSTDSFTLNIKSYDLLIGYSIQIWWDADGYGTNRGEPDPSTWRNQFNGVSFDPPPKDDLAYDFRNKQRFTQTYRNFSVTDRLAIDYRVRWWLERKTAPSLPNDPGGIPWNAGFLKFYRYITIPNALQINNIDLLKYGTEEESLKRYGNQRIWEEINEKRITPFRNKGIIKDKKGNSYNPGDPDKSIINFNFKDPDVTDENAKYGKKFEGRSSYTGPARNSSTFPLIFGSEKYGAKKQGGFYEAYATQLDGSLFNLKKWVGDGQSENWPIELEDNTYNRRKTGRIFGENDTSVSENPVEATVLVKVDTLNEINSYSDIKESTDIAPQTYTIENPLKDAGENDAFKLNFKVPQYYLRLQFLLTYLKKNVLPKIKLSNVHNDNPPIFDIKVDEIVPLGGDTKDYVNIMFSHPSQISFDPRVCMVRNEKFLDDIKVGEGLNVWRGEDDPFWDTTLAEQDFAAYTMNIYLNFDFIIKSLSPDVKGDINVFDFVSNLCNGINRALGGVNNLEPVLDEDTNILKIIDTTPIPGTVRNTSKKHNDYKLQVYGYNGLSGNKSESNFIRKLNLKTAITPQFATMITVGATAGGYTKGVEATAFSKWNDGLVDRYKTEFIPGNKATADAVTGSATDEAITNWDRREVNPPIPENKFGFGPWEEKNDSNQVIDSGIELKNDIIEGNISVATEYFKYTFAKESGDDAGGMIGFIPFKLSFEMDGMSGIKIYNKLTIDTSFLPDAYTKQLDLVVTGISHKIQNQDWTTNIETTVIPNSNPKKPLRGWRRALSNLVDIVTDVADIAVDSVIRAATNNTTPPANIDGSDCTEITTSTGRKKKIHTGFEPAFKTQPNPTRTPRSITLHYTQGSMNAESTVYDVGKCVGAAFPNGGIHWAVDRVGVKFPGIPEKIRCIHGNKWNQYGVGIEIVNVGFVEKKGSTPNKTYYFPLGKRYIPDAEVVDLGFYWGSNKRYFQEYTDVQISVLKKLILEIVGRYPDIQKGWNSGQSMWKYVFGQVSGKRPAPNSKATVQPASKYGGYSQYGLFAHATGGGDHTDIAPTPKIIQMLKDIGYTDNT